MAAPRGLPVAGRRARTSGQAWRTGVDRGPPARGRPRAEFKGELLAFPLGRLGSPDATTAPAARRLWNARERLRLVGRFVPTKRAHRHPPSPAAVFARESAPPRGAPLVKRRRREGSFAKSSPRNDERRARAFN